MAFVRDTYSYEHTYFSIFITITFVADAHDSRTYLEYVSCFYE